MDVIFLIYLTKSFDSLWKENVKSPISNVLNENYSILESLLDRLSVCVRDCMGSHFATHSSEP